MFDIKGFKIDNRLKNYFIKKIVGENEKDVIIASASSEKNDNKLKIHTDIDMLNSSIWVENDLYLGKRKNKLTDNGKILANQLSNTEFQNGSLIGFNYDKSCQVIPKSSIYINPKENSKNIQINELNISADEFPVTGEKELNYIVQLPSFFTKNNIKLTFNFFNPSNNSLDVAEIQYKIFLINDLSSNYNYKKINFKNIGVNNIKTDETNIIDDTKKDLSDELICIQLKRNKSYGSADSIDNSIYLIGISMEFYVDYFKGR